MSERVFAVTAATSSAAVDAQLIARFAGGDARAFDELYRRHADLVYRRLTRLIGLDPEREDLVQQIFVEVHRGLPRFRGESAFATWLFRIVVHLAYEHLRRRGRRPVQALDEEIVGRLIDGGLTPEAHAARRQELEAAQRFLERLTPKKRIAFVLRHVEGLSLEEIGALVDASAAAVGQRVKHAQDELAAMIAHATRRAAAEESKS